MTGGRRFYLAVAGWLAIVAVGSTLVWTVVAQAGRDVGEPERETLAASAGSDPSGSSAPSPSDGTVETGTAAPTDTLTGTPTETATDTPTETPSDTPSDTPPATPTETTAPPPAETHRRTWQGIAGRVVASCTGAKISLVAAQPHNGWRVEVDDRGPRELSVKFELTEEGDDDRFAARSAAGEVSGEVFDEVEVHAQCAGGVPAFEVDD